MSSVTWVTLNRDYEKERKQYSCPREECTNYPLKQSAVKLLDVRTKKSEKQSSKSIQKLQGFQSSVDSIFDPLSSALDGSDPLSVIASEKKQSNGFDKSESSKGQSSENGFEPWSSHKSHILSKYTTSERLSIATSFLSSSDKMVIKSQASVSDKVKNRLEQLDDFEEGSVKEMLNLSQQDYVNRIDELNTELALAWNQEQRVKSLKIAIQCAKLLSDISVMQFYPSKFVLITEILFNFGKLVYNRILNKATYVPRTGGPPVKLPENFSSDQVPESAKETCKNWFYKVASIRELLPRFYVETAILSSYKFLVSDEYKNALLRLSSMTLGIGDPLVSIYAKCFLCRIGREVAPDIRDHLFPCFNDFLITYSQMNDEVLRNSLSLQNIEMPAYHGLFTPGLEWILQCLASGASEQMLNKVLALSHKKWNSSLLLHSILSSFNPVYISDRAVDILELMEKCDETGLQKHILYQRFGMCLVKSAPPSQQCLPLLNRVWKVVMKFKNPKDYTACAVVWMEFVTKYLSKREVDTLLSDIIKHVLPDHAFEELYTSLLSILGHLLNHITDFTILVSMERFLPFIDLFQKDSVRVEACTMIIGSYRRNSGGFTSDPVIISTLTFICKTLHDSINALSFDDEISNTAALVNSFICSVSYGRDFEQQLNFYVDSRANFTNIDLILSQLVHCVNKLAVDTRNIVGGIHSRKTASFVRACAAYSFITIPSLNDLFTRLNLYLVSGQVALFNGCLSQADAFFKAAIFLIPEVPRTQTINGKVRPTESQLLEFVSNLMSALIPVPDNPESGVLNLTRGLLNIIEEYPWSEKSDARYFLYANALSLLSTFSLEVYPYHSNKVESNDSFYGNDPKFITEVNSIVTTLIDKIYSHLKTLDNPESLKRQAFLAMDLFCKIIVHGNISTKSVYTASLNLWNLSQKHALLESKLSIRVHNHVKCLANHDRFYTELLKQMVLHTTN